MGKNIGGYFGERIEVAALVRDDAAIARAHGWLVEELAVSPTLQLLALRRTAPNARRRIYLSTGIHGDEPAGPLAMRQLLQENAWPADADLWICPCLNPAGLARNTRGNADGVDLNRDYRAPQTAEVRAHVAWLQRQHSFDFALFLHEDWEAHGFYVYQIGRDDPGSLARRIVRAVAAVCPLDASAEIDGWPAREGIISVDLDPEARPQWPEAVYLFKNHARQTCTLEAPSDFPLATRVRALVTGVRAALA